MKALLVLATCSLFLSGCHADTLFANTRCGCGIPAGVGPTTLEFVTQPSNAYPGAAMSPPVQVALVDSAGHPVQSFTGLVHIAIERDASLLRNAKLTGTTDVQAVGGVATFVDLHIDQLGFGYTLRAAAASGTDPSGPSAAFNISLL